MATRPHRKPRPELTRADFERMAAEELAARPHPEPTPAQLAVVCDGLMGPALRRHLARKQESAA